MLGAGERLERKLRQAHGCPRGCEACAAAEEELRPRSLLERFGDIIEGPLAMRLALLHHEGVSFPPFSDDPVEQWLVEEALVARFARERDRHAAREDERRQAREKADVLLKEAVEGRGGIR